MNDGELFDLEDAAPFEEERRFLLFALAEVELAIELSRLEEIVEPGPITRAPGAPPWVLGALNLRGQALPVIDLASKLGLVARAEASETSTARPAILIFRPSEGAARLGGWVSNVLGFVEVGEQGISPAPRFDGAISSDLLGGLVNLGDRFVPVLDLSAAVMSEISGGAFDGASGGGAG
ncbi:MAG: chemotaxis protein CheW [Acidobacteriota bacterium]